MAAEGPATSLDLLGAQVAVREQISKKRVRYKAKFKCTFIPGSLVCKLVKSNGRLTIINKKRATEIIKQLVYYQYCNSSDLLTTSHYPNRVSNVQKG